MGVDYRERGLAGDKEGEGYEARDTVDGGGARMR